MQETAQQYIERLLGHVDGQDAITVQRSTAARLKKHIHGLSPKQLKWKPEPAKWSIAEIMAHLSDVEIVVGWRMRSIAGSSGVTTQPYDQDVWASVFQYNQRDVKRSLDSFRALRDTNLAMLKALPPETWDNYGMHLERGKETLSHLVRLMAGHDNNHVLQIESIVAQLKSAGKKSAGRKTKKKGTANKKTKRK
jgi:uncharacterized damage-inducible protein DinB